MDYVACDWEIKQNYDQANIHVLFDSTATTEFIVQELSLLEELEDIFSF